ncbi:uncharacterized protein [Henckelia pumila]|uniref:uncharacterized protein n=1 Tax=Henckelia pumila TaxID=405737 RepID=UPI003C6DBE52
MVFEKFTFLSDRHLGIIKDVKLLFSGSHHAYYLRHLVDNFVKQVLRSFPLHNKNHWSSVLKKAAYAPSQKEFTRHINNILESMPLASTFITSSNPQSWANSLFPGRRWGVMNNNIAECWNNWVKPARHIPIVSMLDNINMLSCKHACATIKSKSMSLYAFCDRYFHIEMYRQAYKGIINPIPTFDMYETNNDEGSVINAPDIRSQLGRTRTKRIPSQVETRVSKRKRTEEGRLIVNLPARKNTRSSGGFMV